MVLRYFMYIHVHVLQITHGDIRYTHLPGVGEGWIVDDGSTATIGGREREVRREEG